MLEKLHNYPLKNLNTFGFDVSAHCFVKAHSTQEIEEFLNDSDLQKMPLLIMGGGSNLLFTKNFEGYILQPLLQNIEVLEDNDSEVLVQVGAGVVWDDFVAHCVENGWYGVENLSLIPGFVGASPVQNIGAYGSEAKDCIESVEYIDKESVAIKKLNNADCHFGYRDSIFKRELKGKIVITQVRFRLRKKAELLTSYGNLADTLQKMDGVTLRNVRDAVVNIRRSKLPDPAEIGNAGSFFKNPFVEKNLAETLLATYPNMPTFAAENGVKIPAGWLIEQSGFKGIRRGNIGVHPKQALVLVNYGGGTGNEVLALAKEICSVVNEKFGIDLEMEVNVV